MTPEQIERRVERTMDHLDRVFLNGDITQKNYDLAVADLDAWAEEQYCQHYAATTSATTAAKAHG